MDRQTAENTITEYLKPVFGFTLKRCRTIEDAEDLSQEILLKAFRALLIKDDINDISKFIWTVAHNALSNYYRDSAKTMVGVSFDEVAGLIADPDVVCDLDDNMDIIRSLQREIAYLSKIQRKILIAYYFEKRRQADIAKSLGIPVGMVKWHLFEAKKALKRGIDMMRETSELKFNPVRFHSFGVNGSTGKKSPEEFFHSGLVQNICYCVRNTAKTVHEIADDLGVSPVYVETEVEYLEEYGFLQAKRDKYILNFIISEPTAELLVMQNDMYKRAAELFANELYDELVFTGNLNDPEIICRQTDEFLDFDNPKTDYNFLLWTLIPYIAACSGEELKEKHITFEEAATIRPDGAQNIVHASVVSDEMSMPEEYAYMEKWSGPMWNVIDGEMFWQIDSRWSDRLSAADRNVPEEAKKVISYRHFEDALSRYDYAWLAERGYIKACGNSGGTFRTLWQIVVLRSRDINDRLLAIGGRIKKKYKAEFTAISEPYRKAALESTPAHLRKVQEYELQSLFYSGGRFLLHCILCLLKNGKLKERTEDQKKALSTLIVKT